MKMNPLQALRLMSEIGDLFEELQADGTLKEIEEAVVAIARHKDDSRVHGLVDKIKSLAPHKPEAK